MKKFTALVISGLLLLGTAACQSPAKTSADAPNSTQESPKAPDANTVQTSQKDAKSLLRKKQLYDDIRAHEERNNAMNNGAANRTDAALTTEVRDKLEANIQKGTLTVDAKNGVVTVAGTVPNQRDIKKIDTLAPQIKGVRKVVNKVIYAAPTNKQNK
jgi:osmotically-inducible protein OsmY